MRKAAREIPAGGPWLPVWVRIAEAADELRRRRSQEGEAPQGAED